MGSSVARYFYLVPHRMQFTCTVAPADRTATRASGDPLTLYAVVMSTRWSRLLDLLKRLANTSHIDWLYEGLEMASMVESLLKQVRCAVLGDAVRQCFLWSMYHICKHLEYKRNPIACIVKSGSLRMARIGIHDDTARCILVPAHMKTGGGSFVHFRFDLPICLSRPCSPAPA